MGVNRLSTLQQPDENHRVAALNADRKRNKQLQNSLSLARAILFLTLLALVVVATSFGPIYWWPFLFVMALFLFTIARHQAAKNRGAQLELLLEINLFEANPRAGFFVMPPDAYKAHGHVLDLDLIGAGSLLEHMNRATTANGLHKLLHHLEAPSTNKNYLLALQEAAKDWASHESARQEIMVLGLQTKGSFNAAPELAQLPPISKILLIARWFLPLATTAAFVAVVYGAPLLLLFVMVGLNFFTIGRIKKSVHPFGESLSGAENTFGQYAAIFKIFNVTPVGAPQLKALQSTTQNAARALQQLQTLTNFFEQRYNLVVSSFFNALFVYDLQLLIAAEKWQTANAAHLHIWFDAIGQIDYTNILAQWRVNHPQFTEPRFVNTTSLVAKDLGHPLIPINEMVCNDVAYDIAHQRCVLITGSNMSGKSTFLRSLGVNVVLAQMGAVVHAAHFEAPPFRLLTAIRVSDDLTAGTSYFFAELKRLKFIVEALQTATPTLVLLDEILRGTNSDDKYLGSKLLLEKLAQKHALTVVATHDLELRKLEDVHPMDFQNWAFESQIENNALLFDYRIRRGVAKNRNATFLMQQMGIIGLEPKVGGGFYP